MVNKLFELLFWRTVEVYVSVLDWEDRPISLILRANLTHKVMLALCQKYKLPNFYVNCLLSWSDLRYIDFLYVDNILKEQLWYNSNICVNGKPLFFEKWY